MMKRIFLLACTGTSLLLGGCQRPDAPGGSGSSQLPVLPVRLAQVESKPYTAVEESVGTVRSVLRTTLEAKVAGRIGKMLVTPGQPVKAGELLAELDAQEIQARLDQANAQMEQSDRELERYTALIEKNAATRQEYDAVVARQRVNKAAASEARTMLGYSKILAPFTGVVTRKLADVGDLAAPGKALLEMEDPAQLRLEADVSEALIDRIKIGQTLRVSVTSGHPALECAVSEIAPAADPASRTFRVKLDLPPGAGLRAGQFGRVAVPLGEVAALRVPTSAIVVRGQMETVFVSLDNTAQLRLVRSGKQLGKETEIIAGLSAGEKIVVEGAGLVQEGRRLEAKP